MTLTIIGWLVVILLFVVGLGGAIFPVLPGAVAIYGAFFAYGLFFSFRPFGVWFWLIETSALAAIFVADYAISALGVKKFGGSRASMIWSTVGLIVGPFVMPGIGLFAGPFLGAFVAELAIGSDLNTAARSGLGALVGFLTSTVVKLILELLMIVLFLVWVL